MQVLRLFRGNHNIPIPKETPNRLEASEATSCPILVILNAVFLITSAICDKSPSHFSKADFTTPGPETPTLIAVSDSPIP